MDEKRPNGPRPMGPPDENAGRASDASAITRRYLDSILIEERLIDSDEATLDTAVLGVRVRTPIMMPAFSHLDHFFGGEKNPMHEYAKAAKALGALNWVGMIENEAFGEILKIGAPTVRIIKPYADREKVFDQIAYAEENGAVAVGMDVDHIFGNDGRYDIVFGEPMTKQTMDDILAYVNVTKLPFVIKGVLSATDAKKCVDCGVRGLLVSHHHGRLPFAVPPLMVLPEILKAIEGTRDVEVFVDCGIDSGADAFKALALGARAAAPGRAIMQPLLQEGMDGVIKKMGNMNDELRMLMEYTGCATLADLSPDLLWIDGKHLAP